MSEEHDYSDNVEFEESEVGPDNKKIGKKRGQQKKHYCASPLLR